mmetsp:Transcript_9427/g.27257  ORF Transcript_9427/g.27257 Transcript_9427/m.27257 type:complete len:220 (-) Transcript_9427:95-754(-)
MAPISVSMPVATTTPMQLPFDTVVEEKSMLTFDWMIQSLPWTLSVCFETLWDSPVSWDCSMRTVVVFNLTHRRSAGTLSPALTSTTSPGTKSSASTCCQVPSRSTCAWSGCNLFKASSAFSALDSCHTPTKALATNMSKITKGSTYAVRPSSWLFSSMYARPNDTAAETSKMRTSRSSNWARTNSHSDLPGCSASLLGPKRSRWSATCSAERPLSNDSL